MGRFLPEAATLNRLLELEESRADGFAMDEPEGRGHGWRALRSRLRPLTVQRVVSVGLKALVCLVGGLRDAHQ